MRRVGLLLAALAAFGVGCGDEQGGGDGDGAPPRAAAPDFSGANLVIISLDTLRADALSVGGGPAGISPALQHFAEQSIVFTHARAQAPQTAPSHMSLFTSTYPSVHGVQNVSHKRNELGTSKAIIVPLREDIPTLAEVLAASGYRTVGLTDGGNLNPPHGFARGFEEYTFALSGAEAQVDDGIRWIGKLAAQDAEPFFLFWHTYQMHAPYVPPEPFFSAWATAKYDGPLKARIEQLSEMNFRERFGAMKDVFWKDRDLFDWPEAAYLHGLYKGEVAYTDSQLERLLLAMERRGVLANSIVIVLADHGEEFFEHGKWQHDQLYEELLRVPLIVRLPGGWGGGRVIDTPVALIDVMPTVLDLLDVHPPADALPGRIRRNGRSFAPALLGTESVRSRPIISEHIAKRGGNWTWLVAIEANGAKLIYDQVRGEPQDDGSVRYEREFFDLLTDPHENKDLSEQDSAALDALLHQLSVFHTLLKLEGAGEDGPEPVEATPEMQEQLEELGYVGLDDSVR